MNTIDLSRYPFLKPRIAAFLMIVDYLLDRFYSSAYNYLKTSETFAIDQHPWIMFVFIAIYFGIGILITLYIWGVLWKILHQHFEYRGVDRWFLGMIFFYLLDLGLGTFVGVSEIGLEWSKWLFFLPQIACKLLLMISILRMPENLFRLKWAYGLAAIVSTIYELMLQITFSVTQDFSGSQLNTLLITSKAFSLLAGIFLFVIFWRAHKHTEPPEEDPLHSKIEEIGE